jgi:hypothetical protein
MPPRAARILERDWCHAGSYARARRAAAGHLTLDVRRNLYEGLRLARAQPRGCALALEAVQRRRERLPLHPPWTRTAQHGAICPRDPLPPGPGWRHAAAVAALAAEGREERPILGTVGRGAGRGTVETRKDCGRAAVARSISVGLSLTAYFPSASLSEREVAVARFPGWGWRVWLLLH